MLRSTANLLVRVHNFFDEIGYNPTSESFDAEKILDKVIYTINRSKSLSDALYVAREYTYYTRKETKFIKKLYKYYESWDMIEYHGRETVAVFDDDVITGSYLITNMFGNNYKDVYFSGQFFDDNLYAFTRNGDYFSVFEDSNYFLRYAKLSSTKMVLTDKNRKNIATIVLSKDSDVFLENNKTQYELELFNAGIAFFDKDYYDSLNGDEPDLDSQYKGFIQWDLLEKDSEYGLSRLEVYDENADLELMLTIAASCFLVFRSYIKGASGNALPTILAANAIMRRH